MSGVVFFDRAGWELANKGLPLTRYSTEGQTTAMMTTGPTITRGQWVTDLHSAYEAYWGAESRREQQAAYHEILLFGGRDGYGDFSLYGRVRGWAARTLRRLALRAEGNKRAYTDISGQPLAPPTCSKCASPAQFGNGGLCDECYVQSLTPKPVVFTDKCLFREDELCPGRPETAQPVTPTKPTPPPSESSGLTSPTTSSRKAATKPRRSASRTRKSKSTRAAKAKASA